MKTEGEILRLKRRVGTIEGAITLLTELADRHTDRFEEFMFSMKEMRSDQVNTDEKMNALIDAQIRSEDEQSKFRQKSDERQREVNAKFILFAEAQQRNEEKFVELQNEQKEMLKVLQKVVENFSKNGK